MAIHASLSVSDFMMNSGGDPAINDNVMMIMITGTEVTNHQLDLNAYTSNQVRMANQEIKILPGHDL